VINDLLVVRSETPSVKLQAQPVGAVDSSASISKYHWAAGPTKKKPLTLGPDISALHLHRYLGYSEAVMRAHDVLAADRRRMPWMALKKEYEFEGPNGKVRLLDLFESRTQLIV
jgi:hypothetical protein